MSLSKQTIERHFSDASMGINDMLRLHPGVDQSRGNRCDLLTRSVMLRLERLEGESTRREQHMDRGRNWHYLLAHEPIEAAPTDDDLISDLNPWQWGGRGSGILHMPRGEVMEYLSRQGAPAFFVALRSIETITKLHDTLPNPSSRGTTK